MTLKQRIREDLSSSFKKHKTLETNVLRMLSAVIINREKEKRYKLAKEKAELIEEELVKKSQLNDEEIIEAITSEIKKRKEAILEFEKGERKDLAEKEKQEIKILQKYLPEQLSEVELRKLVKEVIKKVGATGAKDVGRVMAELMPQVKGRADGVTVSRIAKEML